MRVLGVFFVFIITLALAILGACLVAFSLNLFSVQNLNDFLGQIFQIQNIHLIIGGVGLFLIIASLFIAQITMGKMQREKTIAFDNPDGQVTISLAAIEEFIKRLSSTITEIKDLRSNVIAGKKGIEINTRVSLWAEANIPQTTENIQSIIKHRIQEMLGIEEAIRVGVHVGKIIQKEKKPPKKGRDLEEKTAPFRGSIEYGGKD